MKTTLEKSQVKIQLEASKELQPSSTGKTLIVAKTGENIRTEVMYKDKPVSVAITAYIYAESKKPYKKVGEPCAHLKDGILDIVLPVGKPEPSSSGKSLLLASTHGAIATDIKLKNRNVFLNVNVFVPNK